MKNLSSVFFAASVFLILAAAPLPTRESLIEESGELARPETRRTFFVDSEKGQDNADGLSEKQAWRSLGRVNAAELKPGDTLRFKRGGIWRGSLLPDSGDETAPVTYASYGQGAKPLILGSLPRSLTEDWVNIEGNVWATLPTEYRLDGQLLNLRQSTWSRHQEAGASVKMSEEGGEDGRRLRFTCDNSGSASNHVQLWGPELPVEQGTWLVMSFRARSSKSFPVPPMSISLGSSPWTRFAAAEPILQVVGSQWADFKAVFAVSESSESGRLHINLGGALPVGAVFEFQPISLHAATPNIADPLSVDVGNIIFDHGNVCGWKRWSIDELKKPYDYYYDGPSRRVYLYSNANPATLHESIEFAMKRHIVNQSGAHHVTYDGLALKYGAAHGFGGGNTHHVIIRNCDLSYIGGGHQHTRPDGEPVRYGNAIEFWGAASDHLVENCRIWEVYDAALTNQNNAPNVRQENIIYRNNVIWNCEYSFEYWNRPESSVTRNIQFVNNTCVNAGVVWSHAQRPDPNGSHLMFYANVADTSGIVIEHNIFYKVTHWGSRYSAGWKPLPEMDHNLWFSEEGIMAYWFKEKIESFRDYQKTTGLDQHSLFADPEFLDPDEGDYRLSPTSPARRIRPTDGPVGVESLWD
jgi:hypothetical protein